MNKTELMKAVAGKAELTQKEASKAIDAVLDTIAEALKKGEKVQLMGFGNFEVRDRAERKGRNPSTGEEIVIPATKAPAFLPSKNLKEAVLN